MAQREPKPPYRPEDRVPEPEPRIEPVDPLEPRERVRRVPQAPLAPIRTARRRRPMARVLSALDYLFFIVYGLLAIRFVLALLGARQEAGFTRLIYGATEPLYLPFQGIVNRPAVDGSYVDLPILVAILAYVLLHVAIRGLLRIIEGRPGTR
jgi:uncharacterized protein YggT (Ycf19 family)